MKISFNFLGERDPSGGYLSPSRRERAMSAPSASPPVAERSIYARRASSFSPLVIDSNRAFVSETFSTLRTRPPGRAFLPDFRGISQSETGSGFSSLTDEPSKNISNPPPTQTRAKPFETAAHTNESAHPDRVLPASELSESSFAAALRTNAGSEANSRGIRSFRGGFPELESSSRGFAAAISRPKTFSAKSESS